MTRLENITLVCIDCRNYASAINAINKSVEKIEFGHVLFFTDKEFYSTDFETKVIGQITSKEQYSWFMMNKLADYIETDFCLVIQFDGYVINPGLWDNNWLNYDYIGAPWWYEERNVGNGGFSLRSKKLLSAIKTLDVNSHFKELFHPEDDFICRSARYFLEDKSIKFAPEDIAAKFSFEPNKKYPHFKNDTFGFHGVPSLIL